MVRGSLELRRRSTLDGGTHATMAVREAEPVGSLQEVKEAGLDREDLLGIYRNMLVTRGIEERGHILYKQGKIPGSFYTGRGNEGAAVGVATAMGPNDVGTPLHRDMGVHVTRGVEPWRIFAQYMGREDGPDARPRRQRAHGRRAPRADRDGQPPPGDAAGRGGMRARLPDPARRRRVAVGWCGEGAAARGDAHEAMNFAGVRRLPVVFVCDNNQWAYSTPTHLATPVEHLADRAAAYGFEGVVVDGTDVLAVYREAKLAIEKAREGGGPTLIESRRCAWRATPSTTTRSTSPRSCSRSGRSATRIERFRGWLRDNAELPDEEEDEIAAGVKRILNDAIARADESPLPDPATLARGRVRDARGPRHASPQVAMARDRPTCRRSRDGLRQEMRRDERVFVIGEDVGVYGGAFKVTLGFQEEFGPWRVLDTPLSETAIMGGATGAAMMGMRPVAEMQFADFVSCALGSPRHRRRRSSASAPARRSRSWCGCPRAAASRAARSTRRTRRARSRTSRV